MEHFGFSYVGLIYLIMLFIPNIAWASHLPIGYDKIVSKENNILIIFERVGQVLITIFALLLSNFNLVAFSHWSTWILISFALMLLYEAFWVRYFVGKHTLLKFYGRFLGIPAAGAILPIVAFLLLAIYGKSLLMTISVVIFGIGHIGIALGHLKDIK